MERLAFEDCWIEDSVVASKLGMLMWYTDKTHKERLVDLLSTMEHRPHENLVLAAKGHMPYRWFRPKLKEQDVVNYEKIKLKAHIAVDYGQGFDALVGQVMESGDNNFQPNKTAINVPKSKEEG